MKLTMHRRTFLHTAGAAALGGAGLALPGRPAVIETPSTSVEAPRLFVGCCAYSYHDYLAKGRMTMEEFILKGVDLGLNGVDITAYWLKSTDPTYLAGLRHFAFKNGMPFSGVACGSTMVQADKAKRDKVLEDIKKWVDATDRLGASHLRIFAGELPAGATIQQGIDWTVEIMKPACEYAEKRGITLGVEDHAGITQRAETTLDVIHRVDSPFAGVNLDISNFVADSDEDQYKQIEACVPYATHTHIRDKFGDSHNPIDLDRVWRIFAKGGYRGYMSAEYEGDEDAITGVPKLIEKIKALCRKYSTV
jgi:sugar phosphate isomerase/epimerase